MPYCEQDLASLLDNMQKPFTEAQVANDAMSSSIIVTVIDYVTEMCHFYITGLCIYHSLFSFL